jgi:hypothetical protein
MMPAEIDRVVALGASNLTRGFATIVSSARSAWGARVEVMAALGHGRSYGARSQLVFRALPGILDSGLWQELEARPRVPTRALITDVGNDILYGFSPEQTLAWVDEAIRRLAGMTSDIVVTDLPLISIHRLSRSKFLAFRSILVPSCRLSLDQVIDRAERVNNGLADIASAHGLGLFHLNPSWYDFDPVHIRPSLLHQAWQQILGTDSLASMNRMPMEECLRLYLIRLERRWMFGVEQFTPQSGIALPSGGHVWLY